MASLDNVRLLISDTRELKIFTDEEINSFLSLGENNVKIAAGLALRSLAADDARLRKFKDAGMEIDGVSSADAMMKLADRYISEGQEDFYGGAGVVYGEI